MMGYDEMQRNLSANVIMIWNTDIDSTLTRQIVESVAKAKGCDPVDLPPLYDAVDPDALNAILSHQRGSGGVRVEFVYAGYKITVDRTSVTVCIRQ